MYQLSIKPYYDNITKCYQKIVTISAKPKGPLEKYVKQIRTPKLSPFQVNSYSSNCCKSEPACIYAIKSFDNHGCELLCIHQIDQLFTFLLENKYKINTEVTKILKKTQSYNSDSLICFIENN